MYRCPDALIWYPTSYKTVNWGFLHFLATVFNNYNFVELPLVFPSFHLLFPFSASHTIYQAYFWSNFWLHQTWIYWLLDKYSSQCITKSLVMHFKSILSLGKLHIPKISETSYAPIPIDIVAINNLVFKSQQLTLSFVLILSLLFLWKYSHLVGSISGVSLFSHLKLILDSTPTW